VTAFAFVVAALMWGRLAVAEPQGTTGKSFFLVASRNMPDPVFQQTVILMLPSDEPPLVAGVIINKPTDVTLGALLKPPLPAENRSQKVYFGGPVDLTSPVLVLRTSRPPKSALPLWTNVYAIVDADLIKDTLKDARSVDDERLFLGRAQWAQEQLRGELLEGAWSVLPVRPDLIFEHDSAKVWPLLSQHEHVREIDAQGLPTIGVPMATMYSEGFTW
jgi:putative AlgH/UPF0301 family transcriptional regulator